jgi:hypothetical protein
VRNDARHLRAAGLLVGRGLVEVDVVNAAMSAQLYAARLVFEDRTSPWCSGSRPNWGSRR